MSSSFHDCLHYEERPPTPPEMQKFRRSAHDTGKRYVHHGVVDDYKKLNVESLSFGKKTTLSTNDKLKAKDVVNSYNPNVVERLNTMKAEMLSSKQHKLGKSLPLGTLPDGFDTGIFTFH